MPGKVNTYVQFQTTRYQFSSLRKNRNKISIYSGNIVNQYHILIKIRVYYWYEWKDT